MTYEHMDTAQSTAHERLAYEAVASGSAFEGAGGIAVAVLSIVGLAGILPTVLAQVAGIVFGAAFFAQGVGLASEYHELASRVNASRVESLEWGSGVTVEFIAGLATIALGVLSLVGVAPQILMPSLIITGGVALVLSAGTLQRLNHLRAAASGADEMSQRVYHGAVSGAEGAQVLAGLAAIVLGILSLVVIPPAAAIGGGALPLTGLLVLGVALTISGSALAAKMVALFRRS